MSQNRTQPKPHYSKLVDRTGSQKKIGDPFTDIESVISDDYDGLTCFRLFIYGALLVLLLFAVTGAGVAWYLYANTYSWNAVGQVSQSGSLTSVLSQCTNLTFSAGSKEVKKHKNVAIYNTCPQPRSTCEISLCRGDGVCYFDLVDGAQCSNNQDCASIYNSTSYVCGSDCLCANTSQPSSLGEYIEFTPANVTVNAAPASIDIARYAYRIIGNELEFAFFVAFTSIPATPSSVAYLVFDISNLPVSLVSSGSLGAVTFTPLFLVTPTGYAGAYASVSSPSSVTYSISFDSTAPGGVIVAPVFTGYSVFKIV